MSGLIPSGGAVAKGFVLFLISAALYNVAKPYMPTAVRSTVGL